MIPIRALGDAPEVVWCWARCTSDAPARARIALRCALGQLGYEAEVTSDAVLAVSEFVANAMEHAVRAYEMRLRRTGSGVICEVEDHEPRIARIPVFPGRAPISLADGHEGGQEELWALLTERGCGLQIVNESTKGAWDFQSWKGAKTARFALPSAQCRSS